MKQNQTTEILRHFQQAVEASSDAIGMSTPAGRHYYQNEAFTNLFGLSVPETDGSTGPPSTVYADETVGQEVFATISRGDSWSDEIEMIGKGGRKLDILLRAYSIKEDDGTVIGLVGVHTDITERKKTEEALRKNEEFAKACLNASRDMVFLVDTDSNLLTLNESGARRLGKSPEELIGTNVLSYFPKDIAESRNAYGQQVIESGKPIRFLDEREGMFFDVSLYPTFDLHGKVDRLAIFVADITERKKAEKDLQKTNKLVFEQLAELESIYESIPVGISYVDTDLRYIRINKRLAELNGIPASEHIGRKVSEVIPQLKDIILPIYEQVIESGSARLNLELSGKTKADSNNTHYWLAGFYPLKSEDGTVQGVMAVVEDITQRKLAEKERERLLRSLESKNKELESIVAAASHDMRSPLINAKGFAGEMKKYCAELQDLLADEKISQPAKEQIKQLLDDYIPEALWFIDISTSKAHALSDGLYKVSQFGRLETNPRNIDMDQLIKTILATMKYQLDESDIDLIVDPLPNCFADPEQISQAFSNLIDNAIKYREPSRKGTIHISGSIEDGQSIYCVGDNGIGIAEYSHDKVFEIFHRLNPQEHAEGEGLGLSIVSRIVERANGKAWVQSEPGIGSKFFVGLPTA